MAPRANSGFTMPWRPGRSWCLLPTIVRQFDPLQSAMTSPTTYPCPLLIYGTAWKEEKTAELTKEALVAGFHAVDTANYPTAYNEPLAGDGIQAAILSGIKREDLFVRLNPIDTPSQPSATSDRTLIRASDPNQIHASVGARQERDPLPPGPGRRGPDPGVDRAVLRAPQSRLPGRPLPARAVRGRRRQRPGLEGV